MEEGRRVLFWRRTDAVGLERLELRVSPQEVRAAGSVIGLEDGGYRLDHRWSLTPDWRALRLEVERWGPAGHRRLLVERDGPGWRVDGLPRPDLDGADEPDLSATPFCNALPTRRTPEGPGGSVTLDVCFVDAASLAVTRSRQRYDRLGPDRLRFVDLGALAGFEADLDVDADGLVLRYQHLFERVEP